MILSESDPDIKRIDAGMDMGCTRWIDPRRGCGALTFPLQRGAERLASRDNVCEMRRGKTIGHALAQRTTYGSSLSPDLLSIPACRHSELMDIDRPLSLRTLPESVRAGRHRGRGEQVGNEEGLSLGDLLRCN